MTKFTLLVVGLFGCTPAVALPAAHSIPGSQDLISGLWEFTLLTDSAGVRTESVRGALALLRRIQNKPQSIWMSLPEPTHIGVYSANLQSVGVTTELEGPMPHAGAKILGHDSVEVVLNPAPDHGAVILTGRVEADSITGTWLVTSYGEGTRGQFVMRRQR